MIKLYLYLRDKMIIINWFYCFVFLIVISIILILVVYVKIVLLNIEKILVLGVR